MEGNGYEKTATDVSCLQCRKWKPGRLDQGKLYLDFGLETAEDVPKSLDGYVYYFSNGLFILKLNLDGC